MPDAEKDVGRVCRCHWTPTAPTPHCPDCGGLTPWLCTGGSDCRAPLHEHGCFADHDGRRCDDLEHNYYRCPKCGKDGSTKPSSNSCVNTLLANSESLSWRGDGWAGINARRVECSKGHRYTPENTRIDRRGHRICRTCNGWTDHARAAAVPVTGEEGL